MSCRWRLLPLLPESRTRYGHRRSEMEGIHAGRYCDAGSGAPPLGPRPMDGSWSHPRGHLPRRHHLSDGSGPSLEVDSIQALIIAGPSRRLKGGAQGLPNWCTAKTIACALAKSRCNRCGKWRMSQRAILGPTTTCPQTQRPLAEGIERMDQIRGFEGQKVGG